jgi:nucleoside-diphosphate-sugar epimerase
MRVAVTGSAGFLGSHLVRGFRGGAVERERDEVLPLVRAVDARSPAGAITVEQALVDSGRLAGLDALVHAAAVRHRHGVDHATYRASNVDLVEKLLRACAGRVKRFVYVSSVGVYGFPSRLPITEAHPFAPATLYSVTKIEAEQLVRKLAPSLGLTYAIVRPTIVYGPDDTNGMLDKTARMIRAGTYRIVGAGDNTLHHTHVDDIVAGVRLAATQAGAANEDFVLCGPETITLARFSELVARAVGRPLPRVHVPVWLARGVATAVDVAAYRGLAFAEREPPINHEKLDVMTVPIAFDCSKARRAIGYRPLVGYEEGITRTLARLPRQAA